MNGYIRCEYSWFARGTWHTCRALSDGHRVHVCGEGQDEPVGHCDEEILGEVGVSQREDAA